MNLYLKDCFFDDPAVSEDAIGTQGAEVDRLIASCPDQFGHSFAYSRRLHQAVAAEANGNVESLHTGISPQQSIVIQTIDSVQPSPSPHQFQALE